jgi:hypothetical protein
VVTLSIYKYLSCDTDDTKLCCVVVCCCNSCYCGVMWCDVVVLHMYVYAAGSPCVKTFHMGCCCWVRVSSSSSLTNFFFYVVMKSSVSCHLVVIKSYNLSIVIMCYKFFFLSYTFFSILWSHRRRHHVVNFFFFHMFIIRHPWSYIIIINFFFFCYHRSCCSVLLHNTCGAVRSLWSRVFASLSCVTPWNSASKNPPDFCDARTYSLRSHAPAFMSPTRGWVTHVRYAAHASENASHIATLALDVPFPGSQFFLIIIY